MKGICLLVAIGGIALLPQDVAQAREDACASIDAPSARLACYDQRSGRAARTDAAREDTARTGNVAKGSATAGYDENPRDSLKQKADFDSQLTAATPLRHGYYRLELANGMAYDTTIVSPPPPVGETVHVRRSVFGTTFFDIAGRKPITVRLSRRQ